VCSGHYRVAISIVCTVQARTNNHAALRQYNPASDSWFAECLGSHRNKEAYWQANAIREGGASTVYVEDYVSAAHRSRRIREQRAATKTDCKYLREICDEAVIEFIAAIVVGEFACRIVY